MIATHSRPLAATAKGVMMAATTDKSANAHNKTINTPTPALNNIQTIARVKILHPLRWTGA